MIRREKTYKQVIIKWVLKVKIQKNEVDHFF